ncbi:MAG: exodeoxyribonuclease I [Rectinema sp.]
MIDSMAASILWYDLETFGLDPRYDRIAQFACIRTDENLEEIEEPIVLYCKPTPDYLPSPQACLVHGITPQHAEEAGIPEYEFASRILEQMSRPATTTAGFNSVKFDDEFIRHMLYRNLFDPYEREWADGNSRWDAIGLVRAAGDLRPEGIVWPRNEDGKPLFRLEALAKANGIALSSAHDALHDIRATIAVARLVKTKQPRLYGWYYSHRRRESLKPLIDLSSRKMLLHTAAEYTSTSGCTTLVAPVAMDPANRNQLVAIDLRFDPAPLVSLSIEEIRARVFTRAEALDAPRVPLTGIRLNHCPFLAPASSLRKEAAARLGLDPVLCATRLDFIAESKGLAQKLLAVFDSPSAGASIASDTDDPEYRLYSDSFIPDDDKERLAGMHRTIATQGAASAKDIFMHTRYRDDRIPKLGGRFFARNFPETLTARERSKWRDFCAQRIQLPAREGSAELGDYAGFIDSRLSDPSAPARDRLILHALLDWKSRLEKEVLAYES